MTAVRASEVDRRYKSADDLPPVVVVFGPDRGLVAEVSRKLAKLFDGAADPFAVVKLDAATVISDAGRLVDEARTVSMFGGRRLVHVRDGAGKNLSSHLAPLLSDPSEDAVVLVEAGDLKRGVGLRKEVEAHKVAAAVHCPADSVRDLERMVDEEAAALGLTVEPDARAALVERLGGDRGASRGEVSKACLFAAGSGKLTIADIDAVVGDVSASQMAEAVDAAFLGDLGRLDGLLTRLLRQDSAATQLLMTAQWTIHSLELASASVAAGQTPSRAVEGARPPFYGSRKLAATRALERWTPQMLRRVSASVGWAVFRTRVMPALAAAVARDVLLRIATQSGKGR
ncbi:MAG: DNA polymerase III subunit delta [Pseudomonadota bacterium]